MKLNQYHWDPQTDKVGEGAFGEVFKVTDNNRDMFALKIYRDSVIKGSNAGTFSGKYSLESEFLKGKHLSHTNVIRYIGLDYIDHTNFMGQQVSYPVLIMEYADAGSLEYRLQRAYPVNEDYSLTTEFFKTDEILTIANELLNGLAYLHEQGIIHRDLKPVNILFKTDRRGQHVVKITDFGISRDMLEKSTTASTTGVGTISYMAPEQFMPKTFGINGTISNSTDLWAVGVILYRLFTGEIPFTSPEAITDLEPDYSKVPAAYRSVIKGCLQKQAARRFPDAKAVLQALDNAGQPVKMGWYKKNKRITHLAGAIILVMALGYRVAFYIGNGPDTAKYVTNLVLKQTDTVNGESLIYTYTGWLKNGEPNGVGTKLFKNGDKYTGESKNGQADGKGKVYYKVEGGYDTVEGEFRNGVPDGIGTLISKNGNKYVGQFKNGLGDGSGTYLTINGDKYVGQFKNGSPNGKGKLYYKVDRGYNTFEGAFKDGKLNGSGTGLYANGDSYVGAFDDGFQQGNGTMTYSDGSKYVGTWNKGNREGFGDMFYHNGNKYEGEYKNGVEDGQGTLTLTTGYKYVGAMANGMANGYGKMYDNSGNLSESGNYMNGLLQK